MSLAKLMHSFVPHNIYEKSTCLQLRVLVPVKAWRASAELVVKRREILELNKFGFGVEYPIAIKDLLIKCTNIQSKENSMKIKRSDLDMSRGSLSRIWLVLGAFAKANGPLTLTSIGELAGLKSNAVKDSITRIENSQMQGMELTNCNGLYEINHWGGLFSKKNFLKFHNNLV
jgi:hypothetical protein